MMLSVKLDLKQPDPFAISSIFFTFGEFTKYMHFSDIPPNLIASSRAAVQEFLLLKERTRPL